MTLLVLMRKDWRVYRVAVVGGPALLLAMYMMGMAGFIYSRLTSPGAANRSPSEELAVWLNVAAYLGFAIIMLMAAVFGGISFALERRERWADFLLTLPPDGTWIVLSKLLVSTASLAAMWLFNLLVLLFAWALYPHLVQQSPETGYWALVLPVAFFGLAWLCSTFLTSPAISACISIAITIFGTIALTTLIGKTWWDMEVANQVTTHVAWMTGLLAWLAGTIYYLRRVAP